MAPKYLTAADAFDDWRDDVLTGKPPTLYRCGTGELGRIEIGPGLVTLFGGAPGAGKTAFTMQLVVDALRTNKQLRAVVCNIEMPPAVLLDRQLSRLAGISLTSIRHRRLDDTHTERIDQGLATLETIVDRLCFVRPPFDLENVAACADEFDATLLVLDYIQRIRAPGQHDDRRGSVDATMGYIRNFADAGVAVVVISAVGRSKDSKGRSSYAGESLSLASFRESSELEFGADDAFILAPTSNDDDETITLRHLKARHGETHDLTLQFDKPLQRFEVVDPHEWKPDGLQASLRDLWARTAPSHDGEDDDA